MKSMHCPKAPSRQRGVGLVEILVAVVVLAFGMLGLVGLQLSTLRNNQSSLQRGLAVVQTHSIADAMRADRTNAGDKKFDIAIDAASPTGTTFANNAVKDWRTSLVGTLGQGSTGSIGCDKVDDVIRCSITVRWNDERGSQGEKTHDVTTEVQL